MLISLRDIQANWNFRFKTNAYFEYIYIIHL